MIQKRMPKTLKRTVAFLSIILLFFGCIESVRLLYGVGNLGGNSSFMDSSLADLEVSELVGAKNYEKQDTEAKHPLFSAISQAFGLPFSNPMSMLTTELPETRTPYTETSSQSQSSMLGALSNWRSTTQKIALGWLPANSPSETIRMIQDNPGINVISPTWLSVSSKNGDISSQSEASVIQYAHQQHIEVWPLIDNKFSSSLTHVVLDSTSIRSKLEQNIVQYATTAHVDGINVDFENIGSSERGPFTEFIQELHRELSPQHIKLSVDITSDIESLVNDNAYFHAALAEYCDYVILMAYDEHWAADQDPGPVADVPWVQSCVADLLNTGVPADRLILGIPFYARFWHVHSDGSVTSVSEATSDVPTILADNHAKATWNDKLGVAYARYSRSDGYGEVWFETDATLNRKLNVVNRDGLAGVAIWSLTFSNQQTWSTLVQALQQTVS